MTLLRLILLSSVILFPFPQGSFAATCRLCDGPSADKINSRHRRSIDQYNSSSFPPRQYYLALLLASRAGTIFDYEKVLPAVELAVEKANVHILSPINVTLRLVSAAYGSTCSADGAAGKAAEFLRDLSDSKLIAFVGPACSDALDHVARLSAHLNITIVTGLGDERQFVDKSHFATLTRFAYCQCRLRRVISAMMDRFNWTHVSILYDMSDYFSRTIGQSIDEGLREPVIGARLNMTPFVESFESRLKPDYEAMLKRASEDSRVIILSVTGDILRSIMLSAKRLGMTTGEWVFVDVELFPSYMFGNKHWRRNDSSDQTVKQAYRSLIRIAIAENKTSAGYKTFADEVMRRSKAQFGPNVFQVGEEVNFFIGAFHDAVIVLADAMKLAALDGVHEHVPPSYFRQWWTNRHLVTGPVHINDHNDRDTEYLYLDMDKENGEFKAIATYDAVQGGFNQVPNTGIDWPNGSPPPDVPYCGFRHDNPACLWSTNGMIQWAMIGALGLSLCAMAASFLFYRKRKEKQLIMQANWRLSWSELQKTNPTIFGSVRSLGSVDDRRSSLATNSSGNQRGVYHVETALYQGAVVALKRCTIRSDINDKIVSLEMNKWKNIVHDNIVRVIGACVESPNQCLVTEYCMRGSIEDLINQDRIDFDRQFQLSILYDIANGLSHLHKNVKLPHGRLSSPNCLVDARFVVKLSDWHMDCLTRSQQSEHKMDEKMLYQAPEVLKNSDLHSYQADIYAYGIVSMEVLNKEVPYAKEREDMEMKAIVANVRSFHSPPFRPELKTLKWEAMRRLIACCLEENPADRPCAAGILEKLKAENKGKRLNILESLLMRMEQYTANLETIVQERTQELEEEKRKMQSLLFELIPAPVAKQLIETGHVVPESYESVTIYFSDIVGFTALSAESSPMEVVSLLNDLYTRFDDILQSFTVYKVETIGDAYMVVSGLPTRNGIEHARQVSRMALTLLTTLHTFKVAHRPDHILKLRIGLHSGPCVAGVVGLKMPRYCLFGDTVNTASRMESNGEALKIHVSQSTKELLDQFGNFELVERGEVEMKGKGLQKTYWLLSEATAA